MPHNGIAGSLQVAIERAARVPSYAFHCEWPRRTEDIQGPLDDRALAFEVVDESLRTSLTGTLKESHVAGSLKAAASATMAYAGRELQRRGYLPAGAALVYTAKPEDAGPHPGGGASKSMASKSMALLEDCGVLLVLVLLLRFVLVL